MDRHPLGPKGHRTATGKLTLSPADAVFSIRLADAPDSLARHRASHTATLGIGSSFK